MRQTRDTATKDDSGSEAASEARKTKGQLLAEGGDAHRRSAYLEAAEGLEDSALERLFGLAVDMLCIFGFDGYFKLLNPAWERTLGWTNGELMEKPYIEFIHPDDLSVTLGEAQTLTAGQCVSRFENRYLCKDGSYRWLSWNSTSSSDEGLVYAVVRDVTEHKQLEGLQAGSAYSRRLIEASLDPLVTIAPGGKITDVNSATEKVTGRPREELIGTDFSDCFTEPNQARAGYEQAFREGQVTNYLLEMLHRDGHTTPVLYNASVYRDDADAVVGVFAAARDITEQRRLQEGLRRMSQVFTHSDDSIIILDLEGTVLDANEAAEHNYGRTLEELRGQSVTMIVPPEGRQQFGEFMSQVNEGKIVRDVESFRSDKAGHLIPVVLTLLPLTDEAGSLIGVVGVAKKVTDLKKAEQRLRQYASQLDAANQELEAFSYSVAHDLRTPLRAMDGFSQALLEDYLDKLDEHGQDYLGRIRAASQRMGQLIDDLLELSRVARSPLECTDVDLSAMAEDIARELRNASAPRAADVAISPGLVVNADQRLLRIAVTNLIANAWKFTANQPQATIEFGVADHEGQAAYFVRDNGAGFDMAHAGKLFVPFQRLHSNAEFPGTGIGLAIAARIIRRHGGQIWAEGAEGQGATFHFTLSGQA